MSENANEILDNQTFIVSTVYVLLALSLLLLMLIGFSMKNMKSVRPQNAFDNDVQIDETEALQIADKYILNDERLSPYMPLLMRWNAGLLVHQKGMKKADPFYNVCYDYAKSNDPWITVSIDASSGDVANVNIKPAAQ